MNRTFRQKIKEKIELERKLSKEYPFYKRHPNFPLYLSMILIPFSLVVSLAALIVDIYILFGRCCC